MRFRLLFAALTPLVFGACQDSTNNDTPVPIESTSFASTLGVNLTGSTKTSDGLYYRDITPGTGAVVATGQTINTFYTGWLANGTQFDTRQPPASPITFKLGAGAVIEGWDKGLVGMKVGGTRQLIIPPSLGYGASGSGPIPANAVLVFNVTISTGQ
ncbi:MAG: peptidylprolyl isomerase [Gemmatimonadetes bacterium]|nr:peptidylprolyl isomerase [Gemmatimonadota bacterium]